MLRRHDAVCLCVSIWAHTDWVVAVWHPQVSPVRGYVGWEGLSKAKVSKGKVCPYSKPINTKLWWLNLPLTASLNIMNCSHCRKRWQQYPGLERCSNHLKAKVSQAMVVELHEDAGTYYLKPLCTTFVLWLQHLSMCCFHHIPNVGYVFCSYHESPPKSSNPTHCSFKVHTIDVLH